ncbi:MAG: hypothetical protein ACKO00_04270 [Crocinitomicaceae bacterium]
MPLQNIVSISTNSGYKTIEIHHDDLSKLTWHTDVLVISAFRGGYVPVPNTLIEALQLNQSIEIEKLAKDKLFDFRDTLNAWVSQPLVGKSYSYIVCLEGMFESHHNTGNIESHLEDLLAVLAVMQHKGIKIENIALPFLGTGNQGIPLDQLVPTLIKKSKELLETIQSVNTLYFVHPKLTHVEHINTEVNIYMKRGQDRLFKIREDLQLAEALDRISQKLLQLCQAMEFRNTKTIEEFATRIKEDDIRIYELGILARRAMERILKNMLPEDNSMTLSELVGSLRQMNFSPWMLSYLHTVRSFSNFLSHENESEQPEKDMVREDYLFFVHSIERSVSLLLAHHH